MFCSNCGAHLDDVARFCWSCGAAAGPSGAHVAQSTSLASPVRDQHAGLLKVAIVAGCCTLLVVLMGVVFLQFTRSARHSLPAAPAYADNQTAAPGYTTLPRGRYVSWLGFAPAQLDAADAAMNAAIAREEQSIGHPQAARFDTQGRTADTPKPAAAPAATRVLSAAPPDDVSQPPVGKNVPPVKLTAESESLVDACPYPDAARHAGDTGTVVLLVFVAADGSALDTHVAASSGSDVLDDAAAACVKENGHFAPRRVGTHAPGYWGRMKFNWSAGD
jgi:TonB family protein